jgi:hypothetical protein
LYTLRLDGNAQLRLTPADRLQLESADRPAGRLWVDHGPTPPPGSSPLTVSKALERALCVHNHTLFSQDEIVAFGLQLPLPPKCHIALEKRGSCYVPVAYDLTLPPE